jgi:hypothetical protein
MSALVFNRMLPPQHSYGAGSYPGATALLEASHVNKPKMVEIPGAHPLDVGGTFPSPTSLLRATHVEPQQKIKIQGAHILDIGGAFPSPESLIAATKVRKLQAVEIQGAHVLDVGGAYPGPEALISATDQSKPHQIGVPGVIMGYREPDSYLALKAHLSSLHISLAAAPPGRESAPPSARQAAIDAYTGR